MPGKNNSVILRRENKQNRFVTKPIIKTILNDYGVDCEVNDLHFYQQAFVHRSYIKASKYVKEEHDPKCVVPLQDKSNEMLETLGDAILGSVVVTYLFDRYHDQSEGFLTKTKAKIVCGKTLGKLGKKLGLGDWMVISLHVESENGRTNRRMLEDLFECFIGSIYLDNGGEPVDSNWFKNVCLHKKLGKELMLLETTLKNTTEISKFALLNYMSKVSEFRNLSNKVIAGRSNGFLICQTFILNVIEKKLDLVKLIEYDDNYKDRLQNYFLEHYGGRFPKWETIKIEGIATNRCFTVGIRDDRGALIGIGKGKKKSDAQKSASKNALKFFGEEILSDSDSDTF
jgi:dsRNA-specific ribonuclease